MNLYFDDFELQRRFTSGARSITEADVAAFAALSGDCSELHTSDDYAKRTRYGRRIAHGALVLSLSTGLTTRMKLTDESLLALLGIDELRFLRPVFIGDTIQIVKRVIRRRELDASRGVIVFETRVTNQDGRTVALYNDLLLLRRRPPASAPHASAPTPDASTVTPARTPPGAT